MIKVKTGKKKVAEDVVDIGKGHEIRAKKSAKAEMPVEDPAAFLKEVKAFVDLTMQKINEIRGSELSARRDKEIGKLMDMGMKLDSDLDMYIAAVSK